METYTVKKLTKQELFIEVPTSKSMLNRALVLSAFSKGIIQLNFGKFAEDTRALIACLQTIGIKTEANENGLKIYGCNGNVPIQKATLNVMSAGTVARFLPVMLAFCGGDYLFYSSDQMKHRPMDVLEELQHAGITIEYLEEQGHFPFRLISHGFCKNNISIDTDKSTQYASGILLSAMHYGKPFHISLHGTRTNSSYIAMTLSMLNEFFIPYTKDGNKLTIYPQTNFPQSYTVEPDLSGACYFYALSLLLSCRVCIKNISKNTKQGDYAFLQLLEKRGVRFTDTDNGLLADGSDVQTFLGFQENIQDFSDQALTIAALAPFARTPTVLTGISHIRNQECDRIHAIVENLTRLGVPVSEKNNCLTIYPANPKSAHINTFQDHRVAMAFSLIGLKCGNITIENPACVTKTFDDYFDIITDITQ